MDNYIHSGETATVTAPEALDSGEYCLVGNIGGVAQDEYDNAAEAVLKTVGVFTLPKETSLEISVGDKVYWDVSNKKVDKTATNARLIGIAHSAAASADTTVEAYINPVFPASREGAQGAAVADLAGTLTGTVDGTLADVAAIALSTSDTYTDAAVNTAVNTAITATNLQLKELQTKVNALLAQLRVAAVIAT